MKIIYNNIIPFKGFAALTFFPFIFARVKPLSDKTIRHEQIHGEQQKEMLLVFFYLWYGIEWLCKCIYYRNAHMAYKNISFEREAYNNADKLLYIEDRRHFAWFKYINHNI